MAEISLGFGERLKDLRKKLGLTQKTLANKSGVSQKSISFYEDGHIPEAPILYKLSKELKVSMEELLNGETQTTSSQAHKPSEVININRRREDIFFHQNPDLKIKLDHIVNLWLSGNPYVIDLFEVGIRTAQKLIEKDHPPAERTSVQRKKAGKTAGR